MINPLFWWVLSVALDSIATSTYKKSLMIWNLSKIMFKLYAQIFWVVIYLGIIIFIWFQHSVFHDLIYLLWAALLTLVHICATMLGLHIYKNVKLSYLLPYQNLDKLFIIILWFFLFAWAPWKEVSLTTLIIWIITVFVITSFFVTTCCWHQMLWSITNQFGKAHFL